MLDVPEVGGEEGNGRKWRCGARRPKASKFRRTELGSERRLVQLTQIERIESNIGVLGVGMGEEDILGKA